MRAVTRHFLLSRDTNTQTKSNFCDTYNSGISLRNASNSSVLSTRSSMNTTNTDDTYSTCSAPHISNEESYQVYNEGDEITYMVPVRKSYAHYHYGGRYHGK